MATKMRTAEKVGDESQGSKERLKSAAAAPAAKKAAPAPDNRAIAEDKVTPPSGVDRAYLSLIRRFPLRPLRTDAELDAATAIIEELTDRGDVSPS